MEYEKFLNKNGLFDNDHGKLKYRSYIESKTKEKFIVLKENNKNISGGSYIPVPIKKLDCPIFRKKFKSPLLLYLYIRRFIVREYSESDKYGIFNRYYKHDNKFACTLSIRRLAKDFSCSVNTIQKYVDELEYHGFIKVETIEVGKFGKQKVYIFGGYKAGEPYYYIDEVPTIE